MNRVGQLRFWLRSLFQQRKLDTEMEEEMRFHVEMETAANVDSGMNREEARYAALKKFGWVESIKEDVVKNGVCPGSKNRSTTFGTRYERFSGVQGSLSSGCSR